jgi:chemotaxis family two-component system response regulator Rcp1
MTMLNRPKQLEILLEEDNPGDVRLVVEALRETEIEGNLSVVSNGEEGLAFLRREGAYHAAPKPDFVLLDLNLPRKDGRELLAEIKSDPRLHALPVIVLTTSNAEQDIARCYDLHANCYIIKPVGLNELLQVFRSIKEFWLGVAVLPSRR